MTEADAFPAGQRSLAAHHSTMTRPVSAHSHDFAELAFVRSGHAEQRAAGGITALGKGSLVVLAPGSWHSVEPQDSLEVTHVLLSMQILSTELAWLAGLPRIGPLLQPGVVHSAAPRVLTIELDAALDEQVNTSLDMLTSREPQNLFFRLARLFDLFALLVPALQDTRVGGEVDGRHRDSVAHAVLMLHDQIDRSWTLNGLARELSLSPSQLARVFRADTGTSPMAYLQRIRIERLAYLLRSTELTVAAAAHAVGWGDSSYAARRFRRYWNITPTEYRRRRQ
jgi:AraC-like DNA-binding protein